MAGGKGKITGKDGKPFTKNDPRINREGRPVKLPDLDTLLTEVLGEEINGKAAIKQILIALRKKALSWDVRSGEILMDRKWGKVKTTSDISMQFDILSEENIMQISTNVLNSIQNDTTIEADES